MEKWEIRPPLPQKRLNRSSPKSAWVITSGTPTRMQNFITIRLPPFFLQMCENSHEVTPLVFLGGSSDNAPPRPLRRFLRSIRQMTSFRARMCPLGVSKTNSYISTPFFPQNGKFWPIFDGTEIFGSKGLNNGDAHV